MATKVGDLFAILRLDNTQFKTGLTAAGTALGSFDKISDAAWKKIGQVAKVALAGIVTGLALSTKAAADFQAQMAEVSTMLDESTMPLLEDMEKGVLDLSEAYGESTKTLSRGLYDILSASIPASQAMDVLEISAQTAKAGLVETGVAADALTTLINAFGDSADNADYYADLLFTTVKLGKTTMSELAPAIGGVATIASQVGVSMEEVSGSLAIMTRNGISTDKAVTFLRATMVSLIKPTEEAAEVAASFGIDISAAGIKANGFAGTMEKLSALDSEKLAKIFPNIRALQGVMASAEELGGELEKITEIMADGSPMTEAYEKNTDALNFTFNRFKQTMINTGVAIGTDLLPKIEEITAGIMEWVKENREKIVDFFGDFFDGIVKVVETAAEMKEILLGVGIALAGLMIATKVAQAIKALNLAFAAGAGPVGWIAAGVAVLVTGFLKLRSAIREAKDKKELIDDALSGNLSTVEDYQAALKAFDEQNTEVGKTYETNAKIIADQQRKVDALKKAQEILGKTLDQGSYINLKYLLELSEMDEYYEALINGDIGREEALQKVNWALEDEMRGYSATNEALRGYNESQSKRQEIVSNLVQLQEELAYAEEADRQALQNEYDQRMLELAEMVEAERIAAEEKAKQAQQERDDIAETNKLKEEQLEAEEEALAEREGWAATEIELRAQDKKDHEEYLKDYKKKKNEQLEEDKKRAKDKKDGVLEQERLLSDAMAEEEEERKAKAEEKREEDAELAAARLEEKRADYEWFTDTVMRYEDEVYDHNVESSEEDYTALQEYLNKKKIAYQNMKDEILDYLGPIGDTIRALESAWDILSGEGETADKLKDAFSEIATSLGPATLDVFTEIGRALGDAEHGSDNLKDSFKSMMAELWTNLPKLLFSIGLQVMPINFGVGLALLALSGLAAVAVGASEGKSNAEIAAEAEAQAIRDARDRKQEAELEIMSVTNPMLYEKAMINKQYSALYAASSNLDAARAWKDIKMAEWEEKWAGSVGGNTFSGDIGMASGGIVGGKSGIDKNLVALSSGEFVVNKNATAENRGILEEINKGGAITINPVVAPITLDGRVVGQVMIDFMENESDLGRLSINQRAVRY